MRPLGIGRKNWLFAGSDSGGERIANILTIIETVCDVHAPWIFRLQRSEVDLRAVK
jgi:hypothetical protein